MTLDDEPNLLFVGTDEFVASKNLQNGTPTKKRSYESEMNAPPDGGARAWLIMIGSFFCNGIVFGVINSYSVLHTEIHDNLQARNITEASSKAALVGSLAMGATFMMSAVAGVLIDFIGLRTTAFIGGALSSGGMFISSFCSNNVYALYFTYGIMYGVGSALAYTPSLAILGHYFKKYLGVVNGVVTFGSSVFTMVIPYLIGFFLSEVGLPGTLRLLALLSSVIMCCAVIFKPLVGKASSSRKKVSVCEAFNISIWKNKKYVIWAVVIAISLIGYFVPYVFMSKFVQENYPENADPKLPIICISITSGVGRLIFGYVGDLPRVNRIFLQQISFFSIGLLTVLLPSTAGSFYLLIAIALGMGIFDGCFISVIGPIAFDICGQEGATQAIGFVLGISSIPLTLGPYLAGILYDRMGSYDLPFRLAGIPPIIASLAMFLIRFVEAKPAPSRKPSEEPLKPMGQDENGSKAANPKLGYATENGVESEEDMSPV